MGDESKSGAEESGIDVRDLHKHSPHTVKQDDWERDWKVRVVDSLDVICLDSHFFSREMMLSHVFAGNITKVNQSHSPLVSSRFQTRFWQMRSHL